MEDDATLLRQYAANRSNQAFAELVRRHVDLVYSAALRQVAGDSHLAKDVAQSVFTDLANKASAVASCPVLAGWLHTSTHYAAAKAVRSEQRRRSREQQAHAMQEHMNNSAQDAEWSRLRPVLDIAIKQLPAEDRDAILLRFFEGRAFAAIGEKLRLTENAARMRVERSLEKLRHELARRGINSTSGALATVLISQAVTAAPLPLAASVTAAALTGAATTGATATLLQFMALTKTQVAVAGAILVASGSAVVFQQQTRHALQEKIQRLNASVAETNQLRDTNARLARTQAEFKPLQPEAAGLEPLRSEVQSPQARFDAAVALFKTGQNDQKVLDELTWCLDQIGADGLPDTAGKRGLILPVIALLAKRYPPALEELHQRRDWALEKLTKQDERDFSRETVYLLSTINAALGEDAETLRAIDLFPVGDGRRRILAVRAFDQLVTAQRYDDALLGRSYLVLSASVERGIARAAKQEGEETTPKDQYLIQSTIKGIEALSGTGKLREAILLTERLLDYDNSVSTRRAVQESAARAGRPGLLESLSK